jgi:hypothetical protein
MCRQIIVLLLNQTGVVFKVNVPVGCSKHFIHNFNVCFDDYLYIILTLQEQAGITQELFPMVL